MLGTRQRASTPGNPRKARSVAGSVSSHLARRLTLTTPQVSHNQRYVLNPLAWLPGSLYSAEHLVSSHGGTVVRPPDAGEGDILIIPRRADCRKHIDLRADPKALLGSIHLDSLDTITLSKLQKDILTRVRSDTSFLADSRSIVGDVPELDSEEGDEDSEEEDSEGASQDGDDGGEDGHTHARSRISRRLPVAVSDPEAEFNINGRIINVSIFPVNLRNFVYQLHQAMDAFDWHEKGTTRNSFYTYYDREHPRQRPKRIRNFIITWMEHFEKYHEGFRTLRRENARHKHVNPRKAIKLEAGAESQDAGVDVAGSVKVPSEKPVDAGTSSHNVLEASDVEGAPNCLDSGVYEGDQGFNLSGPDGLSINPSSPLTSPLSPVPPVSTPVSASHNAVAGPGPTEVAVPAEVSVPDSLNLPVKPILHAAPPVNTHAKRPIQLTEESDEGESDNETIVMHPLPLHRDPLEDAQIKRLSSRLHGLPARERQAYLSLLLTLDDKRPAFREFKELAGRPNLRDVATSIHTCLEVLLKTLNPSTLSPASSRPLKRRRHDLSRDGSRITFGVLHPLTFSTYESALIEWDRSGNGGSTDGAARLDFILAFMSAKGVKMDLPLGRSILICPFLDVETSSWVFTAIDLRSVPAVAVVAEKEIQFGSYIAQQVGQWWKDLQLVTKTSNKAELRVEVVSAPAFAAEESSAVVLYTSQAFAHAVTVGDPLKTGGESIECSLQRAISQASLETLSHALADDQQAAKDASSGFAAALAEFTAAVDSIVFRALCNEKEGK